MDVQHEYPKLNKIIIHSEIFCCNRKFQKETKSINYRFFFKNVSSSKSHKKTLSFCLYVFLSLCFSVFPSYCLSFREFKKNLPNTFIYESILIIIYMNTNILNMQIFYLNNYDLKGH